MQHIVRTYISASMAKILAGALFSRLRSGTLAPCRWHGHDAFVGFVSPADQLGYYVEYETAIAIKERDHVA